MGRLPAHILHEIKEARSTIDMETASFDGMNKGPVRLVFWNGTEKTFSSVTDLIREKTQLWRDSWIAGPLDRILAWDETRNDGSQDEYNILGRLRAPFPHPDILEEAHKEISQLRNRCAKLESFRSDVQRRIADASKSLSEDD